MSKIKELKKVIEECTPQRKELGQELKKAKAEVTRLLKQYAPIANKIRSAESEIAAINQVGKICKVDLNKSTCYSFGKVTGYEFNDDNIAILVLKPLTDEYDIRDCIGRTHTEVTFKGRKKIWKREIEDMTEKEEELMN